MGKREVPFKEHKTKQTREKLLVSKICKLTDAEQIKILAYIKMLEIETKAE